MRGRAGEEYMSIVPYDTNIGKRERKTKNETEIRNALFKKAFIGGVSGGITGSVIYALISLIIKGA